MLGCKADKILMGQVPKIGSHDQKKNDCDRKEHPE